MVLLPWVVQSVRGLGKMGDELKEPTTTVASVVPWSVYLRIVAYAKARGYDWGPGRPNISQALRDLIGAGLDEVDGADDDKNGSD